MDVILENDVNLAVLGEHWIGSGSGIDDLAYIALGTGIGAGIMVGTMLLPAYLIAVGLAGPLGLLPEGALAWERAHALASNPIGRLVLLALVALPLWKGAHHLRAVFVELVLGRLVEHDARYNSSLLSTLGAFLDCGGSWVRTAEQTHLHLNTVRYRIARVEELTGRDLSDTADRADLYLAMQLR